MKLLKIGEYYFDLDYFAPLLFCLYYVKHHITFSSEYCAFKKYYSENQKDFIDNIFLEATPKDYKNACISHLESEIPSITELLKYKYEVVEFLNETFEDR